MPKPPIARPSMPLLPTEECCWPTGAYADPPHCHPTTGSITQRRRASERRLRSLPPRAATQARTAAEAARRLRMRPSAGTTDGMPKPAQGCGTSPAGSSHRTASQTSAAPSLQPQEALARHHIHRNNNRCKRAVTAAVRWSPRRVRHRHSLSRGPHKALMATPRTASEEAQRRR